MELVKVGTKIKLTQEDRDALNEVKDIFDEIWNEMRTDDYLLGYGEDAMSADMLIGGEEGPNPFVMAIAAIVIVLMIFTGCKLL